MTTDQKSKIISHALLYTPYYADRAVKRWFEDEEVIEFTKYYPSSHNAKFDINNSSNFEIWFSQLSQIGFNEELETNYGDLILKDGTQLLFHEMSAYDFWLKVKGKQLRVDIYIDFPYTLNIKSRIAMIRRFKTVGDALNYIHQCVTEDRIDDIEDLIKCSKIYRLTEV